MIIFYLSGCLLAFLIGSWQETYERGLGYDTSEYPGVIVIFTLFSWASVLWWYLNRTLY